MKPVLPIRYTLVALALLVAAGCTTSNAAVAPTNAPPSPVVASDGVDRPQVMSYADAPRVVRTLLDQSGLEPIVDGSGAKLAVGHHVVVAGDVDSSDLSQMVVEGDLAVDAVDRMDGRMFRGRVLILAPATQRDYQAWGGAGYLDDWGFTNGQAWKAGPTWITLHLAAHGLAAPTLDDDRALLRNVISHEMFHALTLRHGWRAPLWLTEGFAEVAGTTIAPEVVPDRASLPTDAQVHNDRLGYFWSWQFAVFLDHRLGATRAMRFYFAAVAPHRQATINELCHHYLGASLPGLVRRWKKAYHAHGPMYS